MFILIQNTLVIQSKKNGYLILTVPLAEDLYRKYGSSCCLIQAPQHYFLPSLKGLTSMISKTEMSIESIFRIHNYLLSDNILSALLQKNIPPRQIKQENIFKLSEYLIGKDFIKSERKRCRAQSVKMLGDHATLIIRN